MAKQYRAVPNKHGKLPEIRAAKETTSAKLGSLSPDETVFDALEEAIGPDGLRRVRISRGYVAMIRVCRPQLMQPCAPHSLLPRPPPRLGIERAPHLTPAHCADGSASVKVGPRRADHCV